MKATATRTVGFNRTGTQVAPERCDAMVAATQEFAPNSDGSALEIARVRIEYAKEAEPPGTMPSASLGQLAKTALKTLRGRQPAAFLDKLGERLAFERSGTRLYEALLAKHAAYGEFPGGPTRGDLQHILDEEHAHFELLRDVIASQGGDPTAVTPSANLQATASKGIGAVLVDPRTNLLDGLEVILVAELADNDCWDSLVELAQGAGETDLAERFGEARDHEREHLSHVREWLAAAHRRSLSERAPAAAEASRSRHSSRPMDRDARTSTRTAGKRRLKAAGSRRTTGGKVKGARARAR